MGHFHTRQIRNRPPSQFFHKLRESLRGMGAKVGNASGGLRRYAVSGVLVLVGIWVVFRVTSGLYHWVRDFDVASFASQAVAELKTDKNGYVNIVLLGDGGHVRDGADLVDTILVASVDPKAKSISMLSIPRDFYLRVPDLRHGKINELYRDYKLEMGEAAYGMFAKAASEVTGLEIPYYARVDFNAFVEVVDSLGGITVDVQQPLYDPYYPNETDDGYTVFEMPAGPQEMNGETALKFARSRKTTSDFDRASRQQQVLMAIKDKAMSGNVLTSPKTLKRVYAAIQKNLSTNLTFPEMLSFAALGQSVDRSLMISRVLHDDPSREGGFLYTPERKYYEGQFVLVPDGDNLDLIRRYSDLVFNHREFFWDSAKIEILNGTKEPGIAREEAAALKRFGFNIVEVDNLLDKNGEKMVVEKGFIRYNLWETDKDGNVIPVKKQTLEVLVGFVKGEGLPSDELKPNPSADLSVILGADYSS